MTIEELPSGSYRVVKMYKGKRYRVTFDHLPDEKEALMAIAERMRDDEPCPKGSFEALAREYIKARVGVASPSTIRTYETKLGQLSAEFRAARLSGMTPVDVQAEIQRLSQKYQPKTVKTAHGFIASVLGAYRPSLKLNTTLPQAVRKCEYEPNNEDVRRILDAVKDTRYSVPFQLGVWGCRVGEICALQISDLSGDELNIHRDLVLGTDNKWIVKENPKTDESNRILPLPKALADEIRSQGFIYEGHPNALNKAIHRVQKRLGIPPFKFHALRHYFASYAHSLGIPDADIMAIGGWKTDAVMKKVYRKSMEESKRESINKLSKALRG